jgi:arsenate reductase-like glutaredoxin family protein
MQIYGTKKCPVTRKAQRFFQDRKISFHFVDLAERKISPGEIANLKRIAAGRSLINTESAAYKKRGMAYMDFDEEEELAEDPLLLVTPIVREGGTGVLGDDPGGWKAMAEAAKK